MLMTALAYVGTADERYSPVNHWVSELGEVGVSELATVFNIGLILGGACIAVYMLGVALTMRGWMRWLFGGIGVLTGLSGVLVGIFPINNLNVHAFVALIFFNTGLLAVALFSLYALFSTTRAYPRTLALPGVPTVAAFVLFLGQVGIAMRDPAFSFAAPAPATRLDFWLVAIYEWLVIVFVILWVFIVSLRLRRHQI
jgi:hypothetical membrane protein